jgi:hypothetical protein
MTINKKIKLALHNQFKDEKAMGIRYFLYEDPNGVEYDPDANDLLDDPLDLMAYLPGDFGDMGKCTNCALYIVSQLDAGRGEVYGFLVDDNYVTSEEIQGCGGHDFAIVDGRYIVDAWISVYAGEEKQMVFDMKDPADAVKIKHYFGEPEKWSYYDKDVYFIKADAENFPEDKRIRSIEHEKETLMSL